MILIMLTCRWKLRPMIFLRKTILNLKRMISKMADRKCVGCETTEDHVHMFKVEIYNTESEEWIYEVHCNECVGIIMTEEPEAIHSLEAI